MLLSLDIAYKNMGWAVFNNQTLIAVGCIKTEKTTDKKVRVSADNAERIKYITGELLDVCKQWGVKGIIGEMPSGAKGHRAAVSMAFASAIVVAVATFLDLPTEFATQQQVKKAVYGNMTATKDEMMESIRFIFRDFNYFPKVKNQFEHIADACGVWIALQSTTLVKVYG